MNPSLMAGTGFKPGILSSSERGWRAAESLKTPGDMKGERISAIRVRWMYCGGDLSDS
jgi:hypothetical protein